MPDSNVVFVERSSAAENLRRIGTASKDLCG
jgi:hypothetical protein